MRSRELGRRRIVRRPLIAVEAMIGGVDEDLRLRMRDGEFANAGDGNDRVALAEVRHHGALRALGGGVEHPAAVIGHRARKAGQA